VTSIPGLLAPGELVLDTRSAAPATFRVIGLDLSITSTGVCLPDGTTYRIKTRLKDRHKRVTQIRDRLAIEVAEQRPHLAVIEDLPMNTGRMSLANLKAIAGLHGVVQSVLIDADVSWAYITPKTLKSFACDNGGADKADMAAAAYLAAGVEFADDKGGDQCDAWWLRAAGHDWCGVPLFDLPQAQRDVLSKADWPTAFAQRYVMGAAA
jgi:Holliday junction resolvasome RuvABC endonuclease subunit